MNSGSPERTLIIGDLHTCPTDLVDRMIEEVSPDLTVFLGDFFDHDGDTIEATARMARWLGESLVQEKRIHLVGNHDLPYLYEGLVNCPGYTSEKLLAITGELDVQLWRDRAEFYHWLRPNLLLSHAGLSRRILPDPDFSPELIPQWLERELPLAMASLCDNSTPFPHPLFRAGGARGGMGSSGGILWCDFWYEFRPVPGLCQIFAHTPGQGIRNQPTPLSIFNYCIDTSARDGTSPPRQCLLISKQPMIPEHIETLTVGFPYDP